MKYNDMKITSSFLLKLRLNLKLPLENNLHEIWQVTFTMRNILYILVAFLSYR